MFYHLYLKCHTTSLHAHITRCLGTSWHVLLCWLGYFMLQELLCLIACVGMSADCVACMYACIDVGQAQVRLWQGDQHVSGISTVMARRRAPRGRPWHACRHVYVYIDIWYMHMYIYTHVHIHIHIQYVYRERERIISYYIYIYICIYICFIVTLQCAWILWTACSNSNCWCCSNSVICMAVDHCRFLFMQMLLSLLA